MKEGCKLGVRMQEGAAGDTSFPPGRGPRALYRKLEGYAW